ncbi:MAG: hypothetical protein WCT22_04220 [Patescibacteria group bacterium]|jgi:hypothetical protein
MSVAKPEFKKTDKTHRGNASQFFVAGELCRQGYVAVITMGNCPNTDILCSNKEGTRFVHIQVKTFRPGDKTCSVGLKAEKAYGDNFFWILGGIPTSECCNEFVYYIIPSAVMAKNVKEMHKVWEETKGKKGQKHNPTNFRAVDLPPLKNLHKWEWDISPYLNKWDLIKEKLK